RGREEMDRQAGAQVTRSVTTAVVALLLASLLIALITARISGPIQRLTLSAKELSEGNFSAAGKTAVKSTDEVGVLAGAFAQMAENLKHSYAQLEDYNRTLEEKVAERTRDLEHMTQEAEQARAAAEEANSTKSSFLASMSHELRTPLTAIIGFSEYLLEEAQDEGRDDEAGDLQRIMDSARHLLGLINEILDLSKIEAKKMELHLERFAVANIIRDASNTLAPLVAKNGNQLMIEAPEQLGSMNADIVKIRQSLFNLLGNANKFTEKGQVTLKAERLTVNGRDHLRFAVSDTGIGMSSDQIGRLFQAFHQADSSTSRKYGGTGLGLVITKKFCELMGGTIKVDSEPGKGSTFTMEIPAEVRLEPRNTATPRPKPRPDILLLTDDETVATTVGEALCDIPHKLHQAANNDTALETARRITPNLIALDVCSGNGAGGWSIMARLKTDPHLAGIPIVLLTLRDDDAEAGMTLGAAEHLAKPFEAAQLKSVLARHLSRPGEGQILLVEDDAALREIMCRTITGEGCSVVVAENGRRALDLLAGHAPRLILLDIMMPVMDGFQFLHELRRRPEWSRIPVVVLTAKSLTPEEREFLMAHTDNVIQKRDRLREDLLASIRRHCQPAAET
ncbi:MAG: response regulator, partial [Verrucomicrobiae bacterium]|nr:response regulator [Verrucomicrobiae bacterium]